MERPRSPSQSEGEDGTVPGQDEHVGRNQTGILPGNLGNSAETPWWSCRESNPGPVRRVDDLTIIPGQTPGWVGVGLFPTVTSSLRGVRPSLRAVHLRFCSHAAEIRRGLPVAGRRDRCHAWVSGSNGERLFGISVGVPV